MLMKPKRWLSYTVELNDLLPSYDQILKAFELSAVPLDATFGSNSEPGHDIPGVLLAIGPAVEPARLGEILDLLEGIGQVTLVQIRFPPGWHLGQHPRAGTPSVRTGSAELGFWVAFPRGLHGDPGDDTDPRQFGQQPAEVGGLDPARETSCRVFNGLACPNGRVAT